MIVVLQLVLHKLSRNSVGFRVLDDFNVLNLNNLISLRSSSILRPSLFTPYLLPIQHIAGSGPHEWHPGHITLKNRHASRPVPLGAITSSVRSPTASDRRAVTRRARPRGLLMESEVTGLALADSRTCAGSGGREDFGVQRSDRG